MAKSYASKKAVRDISGKAKSKEKSELNELRNKFNQKLAAVYVKATHKNGTVACHNLMREYAGDRQALHEILACLTDRQLITASQGKISEGNLALPLHAAMFGVLAQVFKKELVDP